MYSVINVRTFEKILAKVCSNMGEMPSTAFNLQKLQNVAFITKSCKMLQKRKKLQNVALITFSRSTLRI